MHKSNRIRAIPCQHAIDRDSCPDCVQEQYDAYLADRLAEHDPKSYEQWTAEITAWLAQEPPLVLPETVP